MGVVHLTGEEVQTIESGETLSVPLSGRVVRIYMGHGYSRNSAGEYCLSPANEDDSEFLVGPCPSPGTFVLGVVFFAATQSLFLAYLVWRWRRARSERR